MNSICIFGVFVADLCFFAEKIPVKGETVLGKNHIIGPGGKGSNQAIAAARLGGNVNFITKIGKDQNAKMALKLYEDAGINTGSTAGIRGVPTVIIYKKGHEVSRKVGGVPEGHMREFLDENI